MCVCVLLKHLVCACNAECGTHAFDSHTFFVVRNDQQHAPIYSFIITICARLIKCPFMNTWKSAGDDVMHENAGHKACAHIFSTLNAIHYHVIIKTSTNYSSPPDTNTLRFVVFALWSSCTSFLFSLVTLCVACRECRLFEKFPLGNRFKPCGGAAKRVDTRETHAGKASGFFIVRPCASLVHFCKISI